MKRHTSAVVTFDDIKKFVGKTHARVHEDAEGNISIVSDRFEFFFKPQNVSYRVKIEATDDPSDSDEKVTPDPVKFIAGFLGSDIPGGEFFEKRASTPDGISSLLRRLAAGVECEVVGPKRLSRILRRAAVIPDFPLLVRVILAVSKTAAGQDFSEAEIKKLQNEMKKKGWKVEEGESDVGLPQLTVDVSGIYVATIYVDAIPWKYQLSVKGYPNTMVEGDTDDPIAKIREFVKSEPVEAVLQDFEMTSGKTESPDSDLGFEKTIPSAREEKTVRPGTKHEKETE
jgi:hypothetical protein